MPLTARRRGDCTTCGPPSSHQSSPQRCVRLGCVIRRECLARRRGATGSAEVAALEAAGFEGHGTASFEKSERKSFKVMLSVFNDGFTINSSRCGSGGPNGLHPVTHGARCQQVECWRRWPERFPLGHDVNGLTLSRKSQRAMDCKRWCGEVMMVKDFHWKAGKQSLVGWMPGKAGTLTNCGPASHARLPTSPGHTARKSPGNRSNSQACFSNSHTTTTEAQRPILTHHQPTRFHPHTTNLFPQGSLKDALASALVARQVGEGEIHSARRLFNDIPPAVAIDI